MKTFAEIQDGLVVNTSVWETEAPQGEQFVEITNVPNVSIGWTYVDGQFVEPPYVSEIPVTEV
jgi:hypothetical protein